jgi:hypothetical protein
MFKLLVHEIPRSCLKPDSLDAARASGLRSRAALKLF